MKIKTKKNENKYRCWLQKNLPSLKDKTILLNGVTGSIGEATARYLALLGNSLIYFVRNLSLAETLKTELEREYGSKITIIYFDYLQKDSLDKALESLKAFPKIDLFFNISGIYHQAPDYSGTLEKTYLVNYLYPFYFIEQLLNIFPCLKVVSVSSLTARYHLSNKDKDYRDVDSFGEYLNSINNKTRRYGLSKHLMMSSLNSLSDQIVFAHPGVSCTKLFSPKNKAYGRLFYLFVPRLMNIVFMKPEKASLSLLKASVLQKNSEDSWVGPRGLFHAWGYPTIYKLPKSIRKDKANKRIIHLTEELLK